MTHLGRQVASGVVTQDEFAWVTIVQTVLPNLFTYRRQEIRKWQRAELEIRPFKLLLDILSCLRECDGLSSAFLTVSELGRIVIPLAGVRATVEKTVEAIIRHRKGQLRIDHWPDCFPAANDTRMAREFLLFLSNYGLCIRTRKATDSADRYYLDSSIDGDVTGAIPEVSSEVDESIDTTNTILETVRESLIPAVSLRERKIVSQILRPEQSRFRRQVLAAFDHTCLVTKEPLSDVLEAAHIVPVEYGGLDIVENGLCLRRDVHRLFDLGHLRISRQGTLLLSDAAKSSSSYTSLPKLVRIPSSVGHQMLDWRAKYL